MACYRNFSRILPSIPPRNFQVFLSSEIYPGILLGTFTGISSLILSFLKEIKIAWIISGTSPNTASVMSPGILLGIPSLNCSIPSSILLWFLQGLSWDSSRFSCGFPLGVHLGSSSYLQDSFRNASWIFFKNSPQNSFWNFHSGIPSKITPGIHRGIPSSTFPEFPLVIAMKFLR